MQRERSIIDMDFSSIDNTKNHVAASTCFEWLLKYVNVSIILAPKLTLHACALLIDNVGNYLYLNNGSFKFELDAHQINLRLHHFSEFQHKKMNFKIWQVCDWLAKWLTGVLWFMDLRWPWVYRRSNVGLVLKMSGLIQQGRVLYSVCLDRIQKEHLVDIYIWAMIVFHQPITIFCLDLL